MCIGIGRRHGLLSKTRQDDNVKMMKQSVCIIAEDLSEPIDEGIKHFAYSLIESGSEEYNVHGLSIRTSGLMNMPRTDSVNANKLFISSELRAKIRDCHPDIICYVPKASATLFSFFRSRVLKLNRMAAKVIMVALQPRDYGWLSRHLVRFLKPDTIFVQSESAMKKLEKIGCRVKLLPSGVDIKKFSPVSAERKMDLRNRYGLDRKAFTVLHVGHATASRNIDILVRVRRELKAQVIFVGSSLQHEDGSELIARLRREGITVLDKYFPDIEELYQLSDCYLFPVFSDRACIGVPLSILEAMACNLPVVSVRYGTLPAIFKEDHDLMYADTPEGLLEGLSTARNLNGNCHTREKVLPYSWQQISRCILDETITEVKN